MTSITTMIYKQPYPVCPHCQHAMDDDDMSCLAVDMWALASEEDTCVINCMSCDKDFWVKGGYTPFYTTAFAEELL